MANANNLGRQQNFLSGIQGVATGGQAQINLQTGLRYHRIKLQATGIAYNIDGQITVTTTKAWTTAAMTAQVSTNLVGTVLTPVVTNGVITAMTITTAGANGTPGNYWAIVNDNNGVGAVCPFTIAAGGTVTVATVTSGGVVAPVDPAYFFTSNKIQVNGVTIRDITPQQAIWIAKVNGYKPRPGEYPIFFTEPWRNFLQQRTATSWDMFGQSTFQMQLGISTGVSTPSVSGFYEFDYQRNLRNVTDAKGNVTITPFLNPVSQHAFSINGAIGRNDVNTLPFSYPIARIWVYGTATATGLPSLGNISQLEIYQDSNKVVEMTTEQVIECLADYGFSVESSEIFPTGTVASVFDVGMAFDLTGRTEEALKCLSQFIIRLYATQVENLTIVMETLPGAYAA